MSTLPLIFGIGVRDRYGATTGPANDSREGGSQSTIINSNNKGYFHENKVFTPYRRSGQPA